MKQKKWRAAASSAIIAGVGMLWNLKRALQGDPRGWIWCAAMAVLVFFSVRSALSSRGMETQAEYDDFWRRRYGRFGFLAPYGAWILMLGGAGLWKLTEWKGTWLLVLLGPVYQIWLYPKEVQYYKECLENKEIQRA